MSIAVSLRDIDIAYGPTTIVDQLNLDIAEGEFVVLLGPSGCGKSTLLSAIAGLTDVSDGEIWIMGKNATWTEPKDRGIGMVFQSYALYPRMTVEENLSFGLRVANVAKAEIATRVARAAAVLQLQPFLKRRPSELSGGQRQRVAIGRALVRDVDIFLFDEPLSNLDAKLRAELRVEIKRLHQSLGNTMIYVTHDQIEAMTLADRIAIMKSGKIQQLGTPAEIYHRPVNLFVAGFIGSPPMNFTAGTLTTTAGGTTASFAGIELDLQDYAFAVPPAASQQVTIGFRPEHIILGSPAGVPSVQASIGVIEPMGADTIVWASIGDQTIGVRAPGDFVGTRGAGIALGIDVSKLSIFDGTGARL